MARFMLWIISRKGGVFMMSRLCHSVLFGLIILGFLSSGCSSLSQAEVQAIGDAIFETAIAIIAETVSESSSSSSSYSYAASLPIPVKTICGYSEEELITLENIIGRGGPLPQMRYGLSSEQVRWLLLFYADENDRVSAAIRMYPTVCDRENWYVVYDTITGFENRLALERGIDQSVIIQSSTPIKPAIMNADSATITYIRDYLHIDVYIIEPIKAAYKSGVGTYHTDSYHRIVSE